MPTLNLERQLQEQGFYLIAGLDEAGRGPLAGPVVAAAVILPPDLGPSTKWLRLVDDSKKLTPARRDTAFEYIQHNALSIGVGIADVSEIDYSGIGEANRNAMMRAVDDLLVVPNHLLVDFVTFTECSWSYSAIVRGDTISYSIASASIVAKVTRDRIMIESESLYPGYGFGTHKGYGTRRHLTMLATLGPSPIHRRSFSPVSNILRKQEQTRTNIPLV